MSSMAPFSGYITIRGFPGAHSDIGGGYINRGLADASLAWMVAQGHDTGAPFYMPTWSNYSGLSHEMIPHQEFDMFRIGGVERQYDFEPRRRYLPKNLEEVAMPESIKDFYLQFEKQYRKF